MLLLITAGVVGWACASERHATVVDVAASDFAFKPAEIRVKRQLPYQLRLQNPSQQLHDWTIDAIPATAVEVGSSAAHGHETATSETGGVRALHVAAEASKSADVSFTPTEPGEYVFYCSVVGHRAAGMEGKLIVVR